MCIACEMAYWDMIDALPPEVRERIMRENAEAARFGCEASPEPAPAPEKPLADDKRKP